MGRKSFWTLLNEEAYALCVDPECEAHAVACRDDGRGRLYLCAPHGKPLVEADLADGSFTLFAAGAALTDLVSVE